MGLQNVHRIPYIMQLDKQNLIWIDLEMTGLDPEKERIIEIATIVTDKDLNILAEGPVIAVHQSNELLNKMSEWCVKTHTANGLVDRVKASKLTERAAELQTLDFLKRWVPKGASPICGAANTVVEIRENIPKRNENFAFM